MSKRVIQTPKFLVKEVDSNNKISYRPVTTGKPDDFKVLNTRNRDFCIAFTKYCPEHATNVHSGENCDAWLKRARMQATDKARRAAEYEKAQKGREEKLERAFKSREAERKTE
jgi:hypothetical protein